jgi:Patatin-like phospholipase
VAPVVSFRSTPRDQPQQAFSFRKHFEEYFADHAHQKFEAARLYVLVAEDDAFVRTDGSIERPGRPTLVKDDQQESSHILNDAIEKCEAAFSAWKTLQERVHGQLIALKTDLGKKRALRDKGKAAIDQLLEETKENRDAPGQAAKRKYEIALGKFEGEVVHLAEGQKSVLELQSQLAKLQDDLRWAEAEWRGCEYPLNVVARSTGASAGCTIVSPWGSRWERVLYYRMRFHQHLERIPHHLMHEMRSLLGRRKDLQADEAEMVVRRGKWILAKGPYVDAEAMHHTLVADLQLLEFADHGWLAVRARLKKRWVKRTAQLEGRTGVEFEHAQEEREDRDRLLNSLLEKVDRVDGLLSGLTTMARPHSLPYRTIFAEHFARRPYELLMAIHACLGEKGGHDALAGYHLLAEHIRASEQAYDEVLEAKLRLEQVPRNPGESEADYTTRLNGPYQQVLRAEDRCEERDRPLKQLLHCMGASALCLSGGGIRSASFSLGILQGLARFSRPERCSAGPPSRPSRNQPPADALLDRLDYLSTVSGGGYIGSWLMAWARRRSFSQVVTELATPSHTSGDPEPRPVRHLREYTSYLSPRYGFSLDSLTLGAIVLRNLVSNWLILLPLLIAIFCVPLFLYAVSYAAPRTVEDLGEGWFIATMLFASACIALASCFAEQRMLIRTGSSASPGAESPGTTTPEILLFALPLLVGAWIVCEAWVWGYNSDHLGESLNSGSFWELTKWLTWICVLPPLLMAFVRFRISSRRSVDPFNDPLLVQVGGFPFHKRRLIWSFVAPIIVGFLAAALLAASSRYVGIKFQLISITASDFDVRRSFVIFGVPIIWLVLMLASTVLSGLLSAVEKEEEREWWARGGGLLLAALIIWIAVNGVGLYGGNVFTAAKASLLGLLGVGAGALGSAAGLSAATSSGLKKVKAEQLSKAGKWLSKHELFAPVVCAIALVCIFLSAAALTTFLRDAVYKGLIMKLNEGLGREVNGWFYNLSIADFLNRVSNAQIGRFFDWLLDIDAQHPTHDTQVGLQTIAAFIVFVGAGALAVFSNLFINVNIFSLHGMYRMRLTRAYLGASNFARHPDEFTNFDGGDNLYQSDMLCGPGAPLHVVNTALNMVATSNMAWQQRKAEPFTFSPINAGSWRLGYVKAKDYGGNRGARLGTAMAISGAAFNPNMGYNSSPLVTLLMTFFNARLGWWLPNPVWPEIKNRRAVRAKIKEIMSRQKWTKRVFGKLDHSLGKNFLKRFGPTWALVPLVSEALGNTDDRFKWIELTDGGHFENLGLYEMVMRRCHSIIVVDADADPDYEFEDLGNAIRKIQIDLGIPIRFPNYPNGLPMKKGIEPSNSYCVLGEIDYGCADEGAPPGKLFFIKPSLNGSEPQDVRAYRAAHPTFPHESTANQFFNESQFESYRNLGSGIIQLLIDAAAKKTPSHQMGCDIAAFFALIEQPSDSWVPLDIGAR